jgi:hypothetical protein
MFMIMGWSSEPNIAWADGHPSVTTVVHLLWEVTAMIVYRVLVRLCVLLEHDDPYTSSVGGGELARHAVDIWIAQSR